MESFSQDFDAEGGTVDGAAKPPGERGARADQSNCDRIDIFSARRGVPEMWRSGTVARRAELRSAGV
jgi:hypothetical protein